MTKVFFVVFMALSAATAIAGEYTVKKDDFSNGAEHSIRFSATGNKAALFINCAAEKKSFWVQIYIDDVIFPDDTNESSMILSMTHKFDNAEGAISGNWIMPMMKYHNAQFNGDEGQFITEASVANRLAVKQNTSGAKYIFEISAEDRENLKTIGKACNLIE